MEELRERIDIIDQSMLNLFLERMQIVQKIAEHKKNNDLPIFDSKREQDIIEKNVNRIDNLEMVEYYKEFFQKVMDVSKKYQEKVIGVSK